MEELPELPFLKVLNYLSLRDRLILSAVSRSCQEKVANRRVKALCYSKHPIGFILGKSRWVSGVFAENFISSTRFASFFNAFGQTVFASLQHLRLCDLCGYEKAFVRTLNLFGQLEELDIIRAKFDPVQEFNLNLPMLNSLQLEKVRGIEKLTLETPRLRDVKVLHCPSSDLRVEIVHSESVEKLLIDCWDYIKEKKFKNLQYLFIKYLTAIDPTFVSSLPQLKEIHTNQPRDVSELFEQKQRLGRVDLKIYLCGLLLNGPHDPTMDDLRYSSFDYLNEEWLVCLAENPSRLANEIRFYRELSYSGIERVAPGLEVDLLKRFTDWNAVTVYSAVNDTQRFLDLLKNCENFVELRFDRDHPQDLFDQLPEHCAVQKLTLYRRPSDLGFIFRLKHLIHLIVSWPIDIETVRRAFKELPALSLFWFIYDDQSVSIEIDYPKQFKIVISGKEKTFSDLNAAIEFIFVKEKPSSL